MSDTDEKAIIRANCKRFREETGWTQQELAERAGLVVASVARYESGKSTPDRDAMRKLATVLGRRVEDFYATNPPPAGPRIPEVRLKVDDDAPPDIVAKVRAFQRDIDRELLERSMAAKNKMRKGKKT